ncbi:MAG: M18 family aminopeptidase [Spirochaetales bacterium]
MKLFSFLHSALTPFHATGLLAEQLLKAGYREVAETEAWSFQPGDKLFLRRDSGSLAAWIAGSDPTAGFRIAAAHTDSPCWKLKLAGQTRDASGVVRIGTEVYGGPIHATWFDRPLSIAGRILVRFQGGLAELVVRTPALAVFPNLAIHYNREVNKGQAYDLGDHLTLLAALGTAPDLQSWLATEYGFATEDFVSGDLFAVDAETPVALGQDGLFLAPRVDNLAGCHAVAEALIVSDKPSPSTRVALFFNHEEIGSRSSSGADSAFVPDLLDRLTGALGGSRDDHFRAKAASFLLSVDAAHGAHPNWPGQHDAEYSPRLGGGPVLKASARHSYATTAAGEALVREAARRAVVTLQSYIMKSTLVPGSTVGPLSTAMAGLSGADVGIPLWAMHSARETAHLRDQDAMIALVTELFG